MNRSRAKMELEKITVAAKRALIAEDPEYFSWTPERQERFGATHDSDARDRISKVLLESMLDVHSVLDQVAGMRFRWTSST